jgi:acetyl-CoA synthetase
MWYRKDDRRDRCPIVDTWWQTETGAIMISPLPGRDADEAGLGDAAAAGHRRRCRAQGRHAVQANEGGFLVIKKPWPSMLRTIFGDHERYVKTYFGEVPGCYFAATARARTRRLLLGDGPRRRRDQRRRASAVDDGVESALVSHPKVPRPRSSAGPMSSRARRSSRS